MTSQSLRFTFDQPLKQWLTGRKRWEDRDTTNWITRERQELFRWNKKHFSQIWKGYHLVRDRNLTKNRWTKMDTIRALFSKIKAFFWFSKKAGEASPFPPSCASEIEQVPINFFFSNIFSISTSSIVLWIVNVVDSLLIS